MPVPPNRPPAAAQPPAAHLPTAHLPTAHLPTAHLPTADAAAARTLAACTIGATPDWGPDAARELVETLLDTDRPFPCTFAVAAAKKQSLRFGFVESPHDESTWAPLAGILDDYLATYKQLGKDTSLVVLFRPDERPGTLDHYFRQFWSVLQFLHDGDPQPWPASTPLDPEELWWEFSFGGTEIFVVCNTPAHVTRHSRHNRGFMITFQPRWVFEGLEADTPRGAKARQVIRNRIRRFDGMEPAAALGNHGQEGNREWRQYFLPDTADGKVPDCPFLARSGAREPVAAAPDHAREGRAARDRAALARVLAAAGPAAGPRYTVLVNDHRQYSLWPAALPVPDRWRDTGVRGARDTCLAHVGRVWTDMRPARTAQRRPDRVV
ncbi:YqcI/YcgG family protein [Actinacidiphila sp. ITFR-21]|uniref:YqcI/YcgG family protein n=1 Tax=Actinacidiphila sp. ITFR-21 TaxID=3075199 RepID=UPI00288B8343|nr:YqcI/YcgG family protein [Streptomyces sp. ITFR-21]WNI18920.1 YqcI/YcgG family protein [Streptomyces sp. ITFR-21]